MANPPFPPTAKPFPNSARATTELRKYVPQVSLKERNRRWDKARKRMLMAGIDVLVFLGNDIYWGMGMANLRYMLQVDAQLGAYAMFPLEGEPVVWHAVVHMNRPTSMYLSVQDWVTDFRTFGGLAPIVNELQTRGFERASIGLVGFSSTIQTTPTFLHDDIVGLEKMMPHARFTDASGILQDMRMVKSEEEIDLLRGAAKIARKVIEP
jgi:Xaa-Pro aminopeptidase